MFLCRVTGTVVSTRKSTKFRTAKLLVVHRIDARGEPVGADEWLALDPRYDAGVGDVVLVAKQGTVVAQLMADDEGGVPANVIVTGVVDDWTVDSGRRDSGRSSAQSATDR